MCAAARDPNLVQLVYSSLAARELTPSDLQCFADDWQRDHAKAGLTGLLLQQGDSFYGVLEGPERRLFARMERLITDPRLKNVRVLREEAIASRRFENWSFGTLPPRREASRSAEEFILSLARRLR